MNNQHANHALQHYYRRFRTHQIDTYGDSGLCYPNGKSMRQYTGGGAAYGYHALAAYNSARSFIHFRERLTEVTT